MTNLITAALPWGPGGGGVQALPRTPQAGYLPPVDVHRTGTGRSTSGGCSAATNTPPLQHSPDPCGGLFLFWGGESPPPRLQAALEKAEQRGLAAAAAPGEATGKGSAGRGIWVPRHNSCQRYPEAARPGRTVARGSPAAPVMPPVCTGASGPALPQQGKRAARAAASLPGMPKWDRWEIRPLDQPPGSQGGRN